MLGYPPGLMALILPKLLVGCGQEIKGSKGSRLQQLGNAGIKEYSSGFNILGISSNSSSVDSCYFMWLLTFALLFCNRTLTGAQSWQNTTRNFVMIY